MKLSNFATTILALSLFLPCMAFAADLDGDSLDDAVEQMLLDRHRPRLVFENDERHWPISAETFVRGSRLRWNTHPDRKFEYGWLESVYSEAQLAADPLLILRGGEAWPGEPSDVRQHPAHNEWYLDINDGLRVGIFPQADGSAHQGMYGHAVPLADGSIFLQYWQLFPHNEAESVYDCGDHEGDWTYLDLYLDGISPYTLRQIVYHHHGDSRCPPTILPLAGHTNAPPLPPSPPIPLPADGVPVCYVEEQSHEWWPYAGPGGECQFDPSGFDLGPNASHHGNGINYRVPSVENIGERNAPMPGSLAAQLILLYNGRWGGWGAECFNHWFEPPDSPVHQSYPTPFSNPPTAVYVDFAYTGVELGTISQPFSLLSEGVSAVATARTIIIRSGSSGELLTISKPCSLISVGGPVTIGQ